jgi:hypothetical protein
MHGGHGMGPGGPMGGGPGGMNHGGPMGGFDRRPGGPPPPMGGWGRRPYRSGCLGCLFPFLLGCGGFVAIIVLLLSLIF